MINSLHISGYKLFNELELPRFGRLNLFVGANNTGKSCLLEAIGMYVGRTPVADIIQETSMRLRDPMRPWDSDGMTEEDSPLIHPLFDLFHRDKGNPGGPIVIEQLGDKYPLKIDYRLHHVVIEDGFRRYVLAQAGDVVQQPTEMAMRVFRGEEQLGLITRKMLPWRNRTSDDKINILDRASVAHIPANGFSDEKAASMWDILVQGPGQDLVISWLRIIEPRIQDLVYIAGRYRERIALVKMEGEGRIPLRSIGDGVTRLFHIGLAMASASRGVILIDEFENGLHWRTQAKIWYALGEAAKQFDVQIFGTTHSRDCIEAFAIVSDQMKLSDSTIYRLERYDDKVLAMELPLVNVDAAIREHKEMR